MIRQFQVSSASFSQQCQAAEAEQQDRGWLGDAQLAEILHVAARPTVRSTKGAECYAIIVINRICDDRSAWVGFESENLSITNTGVRSDTFTGGAELNKSIFVFYH